MDISNELNALSRMILDLRMAHLKNDDTSPLNVAYYDFRYAALIRQLNRIQSVVHREKRLASKRRLSRLEEHWDEVVDCDTHVDHPSRLVDPVDVQWLSCGGFVLK